MSPFIVTQLLHDNFKLMESSSSGFSTGFDKGVSSFGQHLHISLFTNAMDFNSHMNTKELICSVIIRKTFCLRPWP